MTFLWGYAFLLPLLLLGMLILRFWVGRTKGEVLSAPLTLSAPRSFWWLARNLSLVITGVAAAVMLTLASSRPITAFDDELPLSRRNIILAIDISKSMDSRDFPAKQGTIDRLGGVKIVVRDFVANRSGDRIGIVVFGSTALVQSPLSYDHGLISEMVMALSTAVAGDGTAIGDGLALSLKRLKDVPANSAAVILLTDGVDNSSHIPPLEAAQMAKELGIKVHTIGIGSKVYEQQVGPFPITVKAEYDEETLQQIAQRTGGVYFNASDERGLRQVYAKIDELEETDQLDGHKQFFQEHAAEFAYRAFYLTILLLVLSNWLFTRAP